MCVCKKYDQDFVEIHPRWEVILNNGETIYDDVEAPSAWIRLRKYCQDNNLWIVKMLFGFRTNMRSLPENADGYFFCRSALGMCGINKTIHYFIVGTLQNGSLEVQYWKVPEMLFENKENRKTNENDECLIMKKKYA